MVYRLVIVLFFTGVFMASCGQQDAKIPRLTFGEEIVISYHPDSAKRIVIRYAEEDTAYALKTYYYRSGAKFMSGILYHGKRHGEWKAWGENGNLMTIGHYINGVENGHKVVYYPNGNKRYEGDFKDDKRVGVWKFWLQDGTLAKEINYDEKED
jgi:antitoxin component YwqK of YwqJK toxin-antitoxin module